MASLVIQAKGAIGGDTTLDPVNGNNNFGVTTQIQAGRTAAGLAYWGLFKFDLSGLPPLAFVTAATLTLNLLSQDASNSILFYVHRGLTQWYEGNANNGITSISGSTYNQREDITNLAWGTPGGQINVDYFSGGSEVVSTNVGTALGLYSWNITLIAQKWVNDGIANYGIWLRSIGNAGINERKQFGAFDNATLVNRPMLTITYQNPRMISVPAAGTSTVTGTLKGRARIVAALAATSSWFAQGLQPGAMGHADSDGLSTADGTLKGYGLMRGTAAGTSTADAKLTLYGNLPSGSAAGTSTAVGHLLARVPIAGVAAGTSTAVGTITMVGHLRGSAAGSSEVTGTLWGNAVRKVAPVVCENTPLLYITDGTYLTNGQLDRLDLLSPRSGFLLHEWNPVIAQYKAGGYFSDSAIGMGRRLSRRVFENAIEVMTLALIGDTQDRVIWYSREYLRWQELAADYWTSDWSIRPVYVVARAPRETKIRYAIIHIMSISQFTNPYSQPFFSMSNRPSMNEVALRIEREPWLDVPPGESEIVPLSSIRSWTVAGWMTS